MGGKGSGVYERRPDLYKIGPGKDSNISGLRKANQDRHDMVEYYKEIARRREEIIKYNQARISAAADLMADYVREQEDRNKPLTIAGLQLAARMDRDTWSKIVSGEYDYLLYQYMDVHEIPEDNEGTIFTDPETGDEILLLRPSVLLKQYDLMVQEQREIRCSSNKGNPAGNIFLLKAQQGFQDTPQQTTTYSNQTLVIADREQAIKALDMLQPSNANVSGDSGK